MTGLSIFPDYLLQEIISNLKTDEIIHTVSLISRRFNKNIHDNGLWKKVDPEAYRFSYHQDRPIQMRQCFILKTCIYSLHNINSKELRIYVESMKMRNFSLNFDLAAIILFIRSEPEILTLEAYKIFATSIRALFQDLFINGNPSLQAFQADPSTDVVRNNPYDFLSLTPHEIIDQIEVLQSKEA